MGLVGGRGAKTSKMGSLPLGNTHLKGRSAWHTWKDLKRTQTLWVERSSLGGGEGGLGVPEEQAFLQGGRQAGNLLSQAPCITSTAFCST